MNVRDWVDVSYKVVRPGEEPRIWNSRTGLSGGERRLVVLAPMLAAIAAAHDRFGERTGRIVALDEAPSEVDETGREGLARYLAELDLDLIATSHHWDGVPGAWDGIDAHDLETAPDGTVVAFPMLVRAATPLPDDPMLPRTRTPSTAANSSEVSPLRCSPPQGEPRPGQTHVTPGHPWVSPMTTSRAGSPLCASHPLAG